MRCYFMRDGHIGAVEILNVTNDDDAIAAARALFADRYGKAYEGFEVWDRARFIYRFPVIDGAKNGGKLKPS
ncbi:MAG TPA: hypothetical protein VET84_08610 [Stellaceae bacterium]|nr:hypothetical protein [Stellaceae bacterium]